MKQLPGFLALAAALVVAAIWAPRSRLARQANLQVPVSSFASVYVQMKLGGQESKCLISGRSGTTAKRTDQGLAKASWRCQLETRNGSAMVILAESKGEPSFGFLPFTEVEDLFYPGVFEGLRGLEGLPLPPMRWVHLYYNRRFQGLYLQVTLPGRHFAAERQDALGGGQEDGQAVLAEAERLETLIAVADELVCLDRKLRPICPIYNLAVADGVFPMPVPSPGRELLSWLLAESAAERSFAFILSDRRYEQLEVFPLPFAAEEWLGGNPYRDRRYLQWQSRDAPDAETQAFLRSELKDDIAALENLSSELEASIRASCEVMPCDAESVLGRLTSSRSRRWLLGELVGG